VQRSLTLAVDRVRIRASRDQLSCAGDCVFAENDVEWGTSGSVARVDVGSCGEERIDRPGRAFTRRDMKRSAIFVVCQVRRYSGAEQCLESIDTAGSSCDVERGRALRTACRSVRPSLEQQLDGRGSRGGGGGVNRTPARRGCLFE
jgi:hypothetical protein